MAETATSVPTPDEAETLAHTAFRAEVRAFLEPRLALRADAGPLQVMGAGSDDLEEGRAFLGMLAEKGWGTPTWPLELGGAGLSPALAAVLASELHRFAAPDLYPFMVGVGLVGPTLIRHGTPEQQARWLPTIRSGEEIWCQLFSEPGAGSDLAALACRAVLDGDVWQLSGQKVWSSRAHYSRWGLILARTDPDVPKHRGISAFALDMEAPGVVVRPLVQMNGDRHFNEVFLDEVVIPDTDRVAEVGAGWGVSITTLTHERGAIGAGGSAIDVSQLRALAAAHDLGPVARDNLTRQVMALKLMRLSVQRSRDEARASGRPPGPEGSLAKLRLTQAIKGISEVGVAATGMAAVAQLPDEPLSEWQTLLLVAPSMSIRGGTDEIQRNIVGERILGLPPEPRVDKGIPFRDVPR